MSRVDSISGQETTDEKNRLSVNPQDHIVIAKTKKKNIPCCVICTTNRRETIKNSELYGEHGEVQTVIRPFPRDMELPDIARPPVMFTKPTEACRTGTEETTRLTDNFGDKAERMMFEDELLTPVMEANSPVVM